MQNFVDAPLAIVGMACRLPGANDLDEFWNMLMEGRCGWGELPAERFNQELHFHPDKGQRTKSYSSLGGLVSQKTFDAESCPIPSRLIEESHVVHLALCEVAAQACRHAGMDPFGISDRDVGVYVGHTPPGGLSGRLLFTRQIAQTAQYLREIEGFNDLVGGEIDDFIQEIIDSVRSDFLSSGFSPETKAALAHQAASVITEGFNLNGPSMSFDAACASSLRALNHAARALQFGRIDTALVGGASYCHTDSLVLFSQAQSLTSRGSCPFDARADGLVIAEGYVVLVLKTLERAVADGDEIQAVIRSIGISSDGKGKSLWAPREEGQIEAIHRAYGRGVSPESLQYIEMHATSTQVGDATEMRAMATALGDRLPAGTKIPIGSVKANIGHSLEAAGLTSLCKTVLAMRHRTIPPQACITQLTDKIDWEHIPFFVPQSPLEWPVPSNGLSRRAAVSAFGIGGLNVHVVLDDYVPVAGSDSAVSVSPKSVVRSAPVSAEQVSPPNSTVQEPIAIIGLGAVFPGARTAEALMSILKSGAGQIGDVPDKPWMQYVDVDSPAERRWRFPIHRAAFVKDFQYDWKRHRVPPKQIQTADPLQFMLLDAADQALKNAGYADKSFDRSRIGVVVGTVFGGAFTDDLQMGIHLPEFQRCLAELLHRRGVSEQQIADVSAKYEDILLEYMPALIDETGSFTCSTLASRLTKTFDLMGGATAIDSGSASAFAALNACIDLLRSGDTDMMLCASGQCSRGCEYTTMNAKGAITSNFTGGPLDAGASGGVPGEAVGVLLLKRLSDAERDGDTIQAIIRGVGVARNSSLDAGFRSAIQRGLKAAGVHPDQMAAIEVAATGCPEHDRAEVAAIVDQFTSPNRSGRLRLGAAAGQFGYTGGASGFTSLFRAISDLNTFSVPPHVGIEQPCAEVADHASLLDVPASQTAISSTSEDGRLYVGVNSFSGLNTAYHVVLESTERRPLQKVAQPKQPARAAVKPALRDVKTAMMGSPASRIVRIGAESLPALVAALSKGAEASASLFASAADISFSASPFLISQRHRLACVVDDPEDLARKLRLASKQLPQPRSHPLLAEQGIFYSELTDQRPRVAFVFPGQGSQYDGMLQKLVAEYPPAARSLERVDAVLQQLELPRFSELAWEENSRLGTDVWRTQLSLLAADTIMFETVTSIGLRPDRVSGHSFGELAALVAARSWTFADAIRATSARCRAIDACCDSAGVLVTTNAHADIVAELCQQIDGSVTVSHRNAPDQTVAGGERSAVKRLVTELDRQNFKTLMLDVPAAFHTSLMEPVKDPFRRGLEPIPMLPPMFPLLSSVTNRYVSEPADIRENLVVQMTQPVNYIDLVRKLAAEGPTVFVEVGPRQVLTGLHKRILTNGKVTCVCCDHSKRQGFKQLLFARACVEASGALDSPAGEQPDRIVLATSSADVNEAETAERDVVEQYKGLTILRLAGSPYEMGLRHGRARKEQIRAILRRYADLAGTRWDQLARLDDALSQPETYFGPDDLDELRGIAAGACVTPQSVIAHNLRLYLGTGSGGVHFAISAGTNPSTGLLHAVNEDLPRGIKISDCLERIIQVRRPQTGYPYVTFGVAGQVGSLSGINSQGVAVSAAGLLDANSDSIGRLSTVLVKDILEHADNVESALQIIRGNLAGGAWNLCISHHETDRLCYVEYDGKELLVKSSVPSIVASNHQLIRSALAGQVPQHSEHRLHRLQELLGLQKLFGGETPDSVSVPAAQAALRDRFDRSRGRESQSPTLNTVRRVDNQISIVMQPAEGNLWVTSGPSSNGRQDLFLSLKLDDLFAAAPATTSLGATVSSGETKPSGSSEPKGPSSGQDELRRNELRTITAAALSQAYAAAQEAVSSGTESPVCNRFVMRMLQQPLSPESTTDLPVSGRCVVLGDNRSAVALQALLQQRGVDVHLLPASDDVDEVLASFDQLCQSHPVLHLFLMTACDDDARTTLDGPLWKARRNRGVLLPYLVSQRWFQQVVAAKLLEEASIAAATRMGGDFGFSGRLRNVESGALAGLVKAIRLEVEMSRGVKVFRAKVVDYDESVAPTHIAELLCREAAAGDGETEVGYAAGQRSVVRPVVAAIHPRDASTVPRGGTVVVTGGARGVTAVVARELGIRFGLKLHLIGSSPLPDIPEAYRHLTDSERKDLRAMVMKEALADGKKPIDAWARYEKALEIDQTLRSFTEAGVSATYHSCDVSNRAELSAVLDRIRATDGPIDGVVHGAGFERASRFEKKQRDLVERTIAAKVDGAAVLMDLTGNDPLRFFAAFGSVSGRFGGVGQTDYCVANDMLAKLIDWYSQERPECRSAVFHWHAWDDVGMAVRPESQHIRKLHKINFMPSREGAAHLIDELQAGLPETEIVVTELSYCREQFGGMIDGPSTDAQTPQGIDLSRTPMIDAVVESVSGDRLTAEIRLDPVADAFLAQHQYKQTPLMPLAAILEVMAESASLAGDGRPVVSVRQVELLNGLAFSSGQPQTAQIHSTVEGDCVSCDLTADFYNTRGKLLKKDRPYARCVVELSGESPQLEGELRLPTSWTDWGYKSKVAAWYHGPVYRCLKQIAVDGNIAWGRIIAPPLADFAGRRGGDGWIVPSAVLDGCFYTCGLSVWLKRDGATSIPAGIDRMTFGRLPRDGEELIVLATEHGDDGRTASFDLTVLGEDRSVVLTAKGYRITILGKVPAHV